jgi:hypothetical protein
LGAAITPWREASPRRDEMNSLTIFAVAGYCSGVEGKVRGVEEMMSLLEHRADLKLEAMDSV